VHNASFTRQTPSPVELCIPELLNSTGLGQTEAIVERCTLFGQPARPWEGIAGRGVWREGRLERGASGARGVRSEGRPERGASGARGVRREGVAERVSGEERSQRMPSYRTFSKRPREIYDRSRFDCQAR